VLDRLEFLSGDRSTGDRLELQRNTTMTPMTMTMTTNAPAQPSNIATNISPPPALLLLLTATTGAEDPRDGRADVHHALPLVSRDLPISPAIVTW